MKQYILREYGSWGVMTLSYLTGLVVSHRVTPRSAVVFVALALYINSKQAFVLWMRRRGLNSSRSFTAFVLQVLAATMLLLPVLGLGKIRPH